VRNSAAARNRGFGRVEGSDENGLDTNGYCGYNIYFFSLGLKSDIDIQRIWILEIQL
jgi:hypothetical protein